LTVAHTYVTNPSLLQALERSYSREIVVSPTRGSGFITRDQQSVGVCANSSCVCSFVPPDPGWPTEKELVAAAVRHLRAPTQRDSLVLEEFRTSFGLPDILHLCYDVGKLTDRMSTSSRTRNPITRDAARLLSLISRQGPLGERDGARRLGFATTRFRAAADLLIARRLADSEGEATRICHEDSSFFLNRVAVYEAKLKAWSKAIVQAQRHLWFADEALILMPALSDKIRSRLIPACATAGIGLATLESDGLRTVFKAEPNEVPRSWLTWYLNELVFDVRCLDADAV